MSRHPEKIQAPGGTHVWLVLWKAHTAIRDFAIRDIAGSGLTLTDFAILEALLHKGPLPVNDLGRKVALTSGSITTAVNRLELRKLVERSSVSEDRRARIVNLTATGRKQIERAFKQHSAALDDLGRALTDRERAQLVRSLKILGRAAMAV